MASSSSQRGTVFIDWDGTITDIAPGNYAAMLAINRLFGRDPPTYGIEGMKKAISEAGAVSYFRSFLPGSEWTDEGIVEMIIRFRDPKIAPVFSDIHSSLDRLRTAGFALHLISRAFAERLSEEVKLSGLVFDSVCLTTDRAKSENMKELIPKSCSPMYYVGDDLADITEAEKVGVTPLAVSRGNYSAEVLSRRARHFDTVASAADFILSR